MHLFEKPGGMTPPMPQPTSFRRGSFKTVVVLNLSPASVTSTGMVGKPDSRFHFRLHAAGSKVTCGNESTGIVTEDATDGFLFRTSKIPIGAGNVCEDQQQFRIKLV
jgi:hypothetical protein